MAAFNKNIDPDALRQICDIREVNSLAEFLIPGHSLCIIHDPEWREFREREPVDGRVRLVTVRGHDGQGGQEMLLLGICGPEDQGYYRQKLDQNLKSPFLFATWKRETHEFRLIREQQPTACFSDFEAALAAYLPRRFVPECSLERSELAEQVFDPDGFCLGDGGMTREYKNRQ